MFSSSGPSKLISISSSGVLDRRLVRRLVFSIFIVENALYSWGRLKSSLLTSITLGHFLASCTLYCEEFVRHFFVIFSLIFNVLPVKINDFDLSISSCREKMLALLASRGSLSNVAMYSIASLISALSSDPTSALSVGIQGVVQLRVSRKARIEQSSFVSDHA